MAEEAKKLLAAYKAAFPHTIPVLTAFWMIAFAYGLLMQSKGYGFPWAVIMSCAYCGSMQFAAIPFLTVAFDPLNVFILSLMVNARHVFYSLSMLGKYKNTGKYAVPLIYSLCDETFSLCATLETPKGIEDKHFYFAISSLNYVYWITGTFIGCVAGGAITFNTTGLDFALTALFVVLLLEQCKTRSSRIPAIIGLIASAGALAVFGPSHFIIPAMIVIFIILRILRGRYVSDAD